MAGLVTVAISPHKSSCNGSTFWLPAVEVTRTSTASVPSLTDVSSSPSGNGNSGCPGIPLPPPTKFFWLECSSFLQNSHLFTKKWDEPAVSIDMYRFASVLWHLWLLEWDEPRRFWLDRTLSQNIR
jgi:hypothetical protein